MAYLYFIQCNDENRHIKVGRAIELGRRVLSLQVGCPYPLELITKVWCGRDAEDIETRFHNHHRSHHLRGEWFTSAIRPIALSIDRLIAGQVPRVLVDGRTPPSQIRISDHGEIRAVGPRASGDGICGPYPHGRRWRVIVLGTGKDKRQRYCSFATEDEALAHMAMLRGETDDLKVPLGLAGPRGLEWKLGQ